MLKSQYEKDPWGYIPVELLPKYFSDVRLQNMLSPAQRMQFLKGQFYASKVIDE